MAPARCYRRFVASRWVWTELNIAEFDRTPRPALRLTTVAHEMLPEVREAGVIIQSAYRDYCLYKLKGKSYSRK